MTKKMKKEETKIRCAAGKKVIENFKLIYGNSRGVKSKVQPLSDIVAEKKICIVETHLKEGNNIEIEGTIRYSSEMNRR